MENVFIIEIKSRKDDTWYFYDARPTYKEALAFSKSDIMGETRIAEYKFVKIVENYKRVAH